jgi:molybdenum cofactor cytidylyltransferase
MTGLILLAAGASTRLGKPKQQLVYRNKTLLQHAVTQANASNCSPVVIVLGAYAGDILPGIKEYCEHITINADWQQGMGSSIRKGLNELLKIQPNIDSVIIMLCDQPHVDAQLLNELMWQREKQGKNIVACAYDETLGPPVLFARSYFDELQSLQGAEGARKLLKRHADAVCNIPFSNGSLDIDILSDYEDLVKASLDQ